MTTIKIYDKVLSIRFYFSRCPKGHGYFNGPIGYLRYLKEQSPSSVRLLKNELPYKELHNITWYEPKLLWDRNGYQHGLVYVEWE